MTPRTSREATLWGEPIWGYARGCMHETCLPPLGSRPWRASPGGVGQGRSPPAPPAATTEPGSNEPAVEKRSFTRMGDFSWKTPMGPRLATGATDENSRRAIHHRYVAVGSATTRTPFPILRGCSCEIWGACPVVDEAALFCGS